MKKLFFLPALAAMMFSSCSSDEPTVDPSADQNGDKYMAFSISNLGGSRATAEGDTDYEDAVGTEGNIDAAHLYFLFFDRNGNAFMLEGRTVNGTAAYTNMVKPTSISTVKDAYGNEKINGTLVLGKPAQPFLGQTPAQVLCVANPSTTAMANLGSKNLTEVLAVVTRAPNWANGVFLMTNAVYVDGENVVTATSTEGHIKNDQGVAEQNPVIINLERAAAKVRVGYLNDYTVNNTAATPSTQTFEVNGTQMELHARVYGWRLMNYATTGYGFKHLSATYADAAFADGWWNDFTNKRSYWANSLAGADLTIQQSTYDLYATGDKDNFTLKSFAAGAPTANIAYCYENTLHQDAATTLRTAGATAFVVKAEIGTVNGTTFTPIDMVKYAGKLYTTAHFNQMIIKQFKSGNADATDITVEYVTDYTEKDGVQTPKTDNTFRAIVKYKIDGAERTFDMGYIYNNFLWWQNGVTSYWQNVKHFADLTGVVRNHIYDYNITAFNGLGIPGNNPDTPDEDQSYMAAALLVLNWRVVSHDAILE